MKSLLMKSVSGIRGIVGDGITPDLVIKIALAFARYTKSGNVVIGRDCRPTGEAIAACCKGALAMAGCHVIDLGIVPTPTVQIMVEKLHANGGLVISASHNPIEWNAFKFIGSSGSFLTKREMNRFFVLMEKHAAIVPWNRVGSITKIGDAAEQHIARILDVVNVDLIRSKRFTVALDSVNGAGSDITRTLLERLGCRVVPVFCTIDGTFPRPAEPLPENLGELVKAVKTHECDVGFAQDPDADRLAIVDEKGRPIGEEYTIVLVAHHLLSKERGTVVVNLSTTKAVEEVARTWDVPFIRTAVGEINVVEAMRKHNARIGGEGNGGVISPEIHLGRDSLAGIAYVLEMLAMSKESLSQIVSKLPQFFMIKGKVDIGKKFDRKSFESKILKEFKNERFNMIDGMRIDFVSHREFKGGWVHLRPSNTEPIFRIIAEGLSENQAKKIFAYIKNMI
ncbi:MAG: phosphoglucosamine mutase [Spirochaetes bacterium]|nr:phosphoglucosamine mutase [Spirochaetota bacterium]